MQHPDLPLRSSTTTANMFESLVQKIWRSAPRHDSSEKSFNEDQESLLEHVGDESLLASSRVPNWSKWTIAMLATLLSLAILSNPFIMRPLRRDMDKLCITHTSEYPSPVDNDLDIIWATKSFNGSFKKQTIYRQRASPEVDQAWRDLGAYAQPFAIREDEGEKYGLRPWQVKRIPEQGGGFVAILESTHHLHCLNVLRQASHFDWDYYRSAALANGKGVFADTEDVVALHVSHCLDMLRQRLMCTADTTVCGQVWVEDYGPLVFANVERKCRNYDEITQWAKERELPPGQNLVRKRPGDFVYPEFP